MVLENLVGCGEVEAPLLIGETAVHSLKDGCGTAGTFRVCLEFHIFVKVKGLMVKDERGEEGELRREGNDSKL